MVRRAELKRRQPDMMVGVDKTGNHREVDAAGHHRIGVARAQLRNRRNLAYVAIDADKAGIAEQNWFARRVETLK